MIKINKKIKIFSLLIFGGTVSLISINFYKKFYSQFEVDLNEIIKNNNNAEKNCNNQIARDDDPFEIIRDFKSKEDIDNYFLKKINIALYDPPLTNKLYPKSNLYGHELIRYFDK